MRNIFTSPDSARVGYYCSILKEAGFNAFVRNDNVSGAEVMIPAFYPSVCIIDDDRYDEAMEIIARHKDAPIIAGPDWTCPHCHEAVPDSFDSCWNCECNRPSEPTPATVDALSGSHLREDYLTKVAVMNRHVFRMWVCFPLLCTIISQFPIRWIFERGSIGRDIASVVVPGLIIFITALIIRRIDRQRGFHCPSCGTSLTLGQDAEEIATTGLCPECETPLFQNPNPS